MLTLMFWNMNGRNRERLCADLAHDHAVSVLALAECSRPLALLQSLNPVGQSALYYPIPTSPTCRVKLFARYPPSELPAELETTHYMIRCFRHAGADELLLVVLHERSKQRRNDAEQDGDFRDLARTISEVEDRRRHTRTLLIGDLNADPFQEGVFSADGLHAVSSRTVASGGSRVVAGNRYRYFYNPMWRFFGDAGGPPGTYYRRKAERLCRFWHVFDQVMIRPELIPYLVDHELQILTGYQGVSFQRPNQTPDPDVASDHLPILVKLNYPGVP